MRILKFLLPVLFLLTFLSCGSDPAKPAALGKIKGVVFDAVSGSPLDKALVTTKPPTYAVTTDTLGAYLIENVKAAVYHVVATKAGYDSAGVDVEVQSGMETTADIALLPDSTGGNLP